VAQIQAVIDSGIVPVVVAMLPNAPLEVRKEAVWALGNFTSGCNEEQANYFLTTVRCVPPRPSSYLEACFHTAIGYLGRTYRPDICPVRFEC
jgi:hypothetical protein